MAEFDIHWINISVYSVSRLGGRSECEIEGRGADDQQGRGPDQVEVDPAPP
jgi:hypothetical protein